jgi:glutathione synthase/RimK-type ligase-like ATP-grasp enzyme
MKADIALLTDRRYVATHAPEGDWYLGNILQEDQLLQAAFTRLGLTAVRVDWSLPQHDWSQYRCAVFRTTWDYFDRFEQFTGWLARVQQQCALCNPLSTIRWNMDKHYLADLEAKGVPIVPTRFLERGTNIDLANLLTLNGWNEAVIKPCVSGAARHTYRVNRDTATEVAAVVQPLLANEAFMLQPFERGIVLNGEDSLMVFNGRYSHAVRKTAKAGDFRVQDDYGGTVRACEPNAAQIALAERAVAVCSPRPAYARVDMVQCENGSLAIMELELIEPELWMRFHPPAATAFAHAVAASLA